MKVNLGSLGTVDVNPDEVSYVDLDSEEFTFGGERLTEARAEQIAREVARKHGLKGGRPAKPECERASVQKAFRLTPGEAHRLAETAAARGMSESALVRAAISEYLAA